MSVLSLSNLQVSYNNTPVISELSLEVETGEIVALFGPSGGGKSTILKAISGLLDEVTGNIVIAGEEVQTADFVLPPEKRHAGLIFQDYALFPHLTVAENIAFGLNDLPQEQQQSKTEEMLKLIKLPSYAKKYPHELSGGQQQRIAIARALACEPKILLFDEAFSNIDPQFRFELIAEIRQILKSQNIAGLFVTHNQDEAFAFCDRIAVLNNGCIEQIADAETLFNQPETRFVAEFLGQGIWLDCTVDSGINLTSELGSIAYNGGQNLSDWTGQQVQVYVRPHQLQLVQNQQGKFVIDHERFVGEFYESTVTWFGQQIKVRTKHSFLNQSIDLKVDTHVAKVFLLD